MMKLSLMKEFFRTVDNERRSPVADLIAQRWVEPGAAVRCERASANFVCEVSAGDQRYFLRFNHSSERDRAPIAAEVLYLQHLSRQGVRVAKPVQSRYGNSVETVLTGLGTFHAVLFEALKGEELEIAALDERHFELWGQALGRTHAASQGFTTPDRPSWSDHLAMVKRLIPSEERCAREEFTFVQAKIQQLPVEPGNFGLIHCDFELDNIKWEQDEVAALDFDDCSFCWFIADVAFALRDLFDDCVSGIKPADPRFRAFVNGYSAARPMPIDAACQIRLFLRMHNLITFAKILRTVEDTADGEPAWTVDLRQLLARKLGRYRLAFQNHPLRTFADRD